MAAKKPQTLENHRRFVPLFHGVTFALLMINLVYTVYRMSTAFRVQTLVAVLTAFALLLLFSHIRGFATQNQDRIIRLEERLRLARLLPDEMKRRIDEFTVRQLVALRFASDAELPALAQRVLDEKMDREEIKKLIREWRADHCRV